MSTSQKQAVTNAVLSILPSYELGGEEIANDVMSAAQKSEAREILFNGFRANEISYKDEFATKVQDDVILKKYVSGLLNNWLRKNPEFNNGIKYEAKNPGSRAGSGDAQVRELKKLLKQVKWTESESDVQTAFDNRIAEIKPTQTITINVDALPESLRHLVK